MWVGMAKSWTEQLYELHAAEATYISGFLPIGSAMQVTGGQLFKADRDLCTSHMRIYDAWH